MASSPWKRLAAHLKDDTEESIYLDRLRARVGAEEQQSLLEHELAEEMASALGRTAAKVDRALAELKKAETDIERAEDDEALAATIARFNQIWDRADRALTDLVIHREAIGIRNNEALRRRYPMPPRRR